MDEERPMSNCVSKEWMCRKKTVFFILLGLCLGAILFQTKLTTLTTPSMMTWGGKIVAWQRLSQVMIGKSLPAQNQSQSTVSISETDRKDSRSVVDLLRGNDDKSTAKKRPGTRLQTSQSKTLYSHNFDAEEQKHKLPDSRGIQNKTNSYLPQNDERKHLIPKNSDMKNNLLREASTGNNPKWLPLDRNHPDVFVYAAYYDDVDRIPFVRVLVTKAGPAVNYTVQCVYFEDDIYQPIGMSLGVLSSYWRWRSPSYNGAFAKCPLLHPHHHPYAVSLVKDDDRRSDVKAFDKDVTSVLQVHYGKNGTSSDSHDGRPEEEDREGVRGRSWKKWNLTKCFPCLHRYQGTLQLLQQVEIGRALGIDHFVFYNLSTKSPDVNKLLDYYQETGVAEVLDWHYPARMSPSHYYHQFQAIQDCLYRSLHTSQYVLFGDLDEIAVPRSTSSLPTLLTQLFDQKPHCGAFLFFNTFFPSNKHTLPPNPSHVPPPNSTARPPQDHQTASARSDQEAFARRYGLNMLLIGTRVNEVWQDGRRAKPAVMPGRIEASSVHKVLALRRRYTQCGIPPDLGLLHHYRMAVPDSLGVKHYRKYRGYVADTSLIRLADLIVPRIKRVLNHLGWTKEGLG